MGKREHFIKGLYKGRYLIAIYDKWDYPVIIADNPKQLINFYKNKNSAASSMAHIMNGREKLNVYFIDVLENHSDIFRLEDYLFIKNFENLRENNKK